MSMLSRPKQHIVIVCCGSTILYSSSNPSSHGSNHTQHQDSLLLASSVIWVLSLDNLGALSPSKPTESMFMRPSVLLDLVEATGGSLEVGGADVLADIEAILRVMTPVAVGDGCGKYVMLCVVMGRMVPSSIG